MDFADDFVVDDPLIFFIFLKGDLLQIYSGLRVILVYFGFTNFGVLELFRIFFTKFGVLELFWISHKCLLFFIGLARI